MGLQRKGAGPVAKTPEAGTLNKRPARRNLETRLTVVAVLKIPEIFLNNEPGPICAFATGPEPLRFSPCLSCRLPFLRVLSALRVSILPHRQSGRGAVRP